MKQGDIEALKREAARQGWRHAKTKRGHTQFYSPDKETIVVFGGTPSDHRSWENGMADMRRAGFIDPTAYDEQSVGTSLGDVLRAKLNGTGVETVSHDIEDEGKTKIPFRPHLIQALKELGPSGRNTLMARVNQLRAQEGMPRLDEAQFSKNLFNAKKVDVVIRDRSTGEYRLPKTPGSPGNPLQSVAPPVVVKQPSPAEAMVPGNEDDDIVRLDRALAALGEIESVVRKHKNLILKFRELRKAMGGEGDL